MPPPRIELLATGDELLDGTVVDTNSPWLMAELAERGLAVARKTIVADDRDDLIAALRETSARSDVVVVSGGLGPTSDDLTAACAAEAAGVALRFDAGTLLALEARLRARGIAVTPNNRRQAEVPETATVIPNRFGTAPMLALAFGQARLFLLPGVPREFVGLCREELLPRLAALGSEGGRKVRRLSCFGIAESALDAKLADLPQHFPGLALGYRTTPPENQAKLLASGPGAEATLAAATAEARARLGADCFGVDGETFSAAVGAALRGAGATVALAESLTAGRAASLLAETPGASRILVGSFVVYAERLKSSVLGIDPGLLAREGAVSSAVAEAMAERARILAGSSHGVSCTGLAGPDGDGRHPVGTVFTALADAGRVESRAHHFGGDRDRIREFSAYAMLDALRRRFLG